MAEIRDLKKKQAQLERIVPEYRRLLRELPVPYVNDNGRVSVEAGRKIGSATYILDARQTGGASSMQIDQQMVEKLCTERRGCEISLVLREIGLLDAKPGNSTISGPCLFDYEPQTGTWIRGRGCSGGQLSGEDGGDSFGAGAGAEIVTEAGMGCLFSDADIRKTVGVDQEPFDRDHGQNLFLVALPDRQTDEKLRFRCELHME